MDKYNIYLFVSCSKENFKIKLTADLANVFSFYLIFVNCIIPRVSHRPLHCIFTEADFKK